MLGLDLECRGSKAATISLWRVAWDKTADGRPLVRHEKVVSEQVDHFRHPLIPSSSPVRSNHGYDDAMINSLSRLFETHQVLWSTVR